MDVQRRRRGSEPVGRAEAPQRQSGGLPPSGGNLPSFGGLPRRGGQICGCGTIIVLILIVGYYLLTGGQSTSSPAPTNSQDNTGIQPAEAVLPASNYTPPVPGASSGQTWTVMLYQDADDQVLEQDVFLNLNEAERVGSSKSVNIVAQIDRFRSGFQGDGNWTSARRYYVTQDNDLNAIHSQLIQDLGEVDMSSGQTLVDFVQSAVKNYPANRYVLILSDHGMGWPGGWSDPSPGG